MKNKCGKGHIFDNDEKKQEMLKFRMMGYSYGKLSRKYEVHHTTIMHHCRVAGIAIGKIKRKKLYELIKAGLSFQAIFEKMNVFPKTVELYIKMFGKHGNKLFSVNKKLPKYSTYSTITSLSKIDSRGTEWVLGLRGEWICAGKSEKAEKKSDEERKKRALELKRIEMLKY